MRKQVVINFFNVLFLKINYFSLFYTFIIFIICVKLVFQVLTNLINQLIKTQSYKLCIVTNYIITMHFIASYFFSVTTY